MPKESPRTISHALTPFTICSSACHPNATQPGSSPNGGAVAGVAAGVAAGEVAVGRLPPPVPDGGGGRKPPRPPAGAAAAGARGAALGFALWPTLMLRLPFKLLDVVLQRHVEVEGVVPLLEAHAEEGVTPRVVHDAQHEVPAAVGDRLDRHLRLVVIEGALRKQRACVDVLELDGALGALGHHPHATAEDVARLGPVLASEAAVRSRRQRVDVALAQHG
eukprot:scaffold3332_cov51-Phaeocystis_antarctica.AAC.1